MMNVVGTGDLPPSPCHIVSSRPVFGAAMLWPGCGESYVEQVAFTFKKSASSGGCFVAEWADCG